MDTPTMEGAVGQRDRGAIAAASLTVLNAALLVTVLVLSYGSQRVAFGQPRLIGRYTTFSGKPWDTNSDS